MSDIDFDDLKRHSLVSGMQTLYKVQDVRDDKVVLEAVYPPPGRTTVVTFSREEAEAVLHHPDDETVLRYEKHYGLPS